MTGAGPGAELSGNRVLVTGATGFIGGRLVERLALDCHAQPRALVRNWARAARIARLGIDMVQGDVMNPHDVENAMRGCDVVCHCAYGTSGGPRWRALVDGKGTANVLESARKLGVRRVVYLSTLLVYGLTPDGDLDENAPKRRFGSPYSDSKSRAERLAHRYFRDFRVPVAILQPTAVYGPFGGVWTTAVINNLKAGRTILVNGGDGLCNAVYVDDLVSAMLLAAVRDEAVGHEFLISGEQPVTWQDFYGRFGRILGGTPRTVSMTADEARAHYRRNGRPKTFLSEALQILRDDQSLQKRLMKTREPGMLIDLVRSALPARMQESLKERLRRTASPLPASRSTGREPAIHPVDPKMIAFFASKTRILINRSKELLGYRPQYDFDSGMRATEQWARWANLV